jgi:hypothetical protein
MTLGPYVEGLCDNRSDHEPYTFVMGMYVVWCTADQSQRLPYAAERARRLVGKRS